MKNLSIFFIVTLTIAFISCDKDLVNDTIANRAIYTLDIDEDAHVFINNDGNRYIEDTLISQQDSLVFELKMNKGIKYRISVSQPNTLINKTKLTLVNQIGDTLAESINESISKSFIALESPETTNYYLIVQLRSRTNPAFVFRLFYEELVDDVFTFADKNWEYNGNWKIDNPNSAELINYNSRILRHLKLIDDIAGDPNVSFVIQSTSIRDFSYGFIMEGSDEFRLDIKSAYELTKRGYAFLINNEMSQYSIMNLSPGSIFYDWGSLEHMNIDVEAGVYIELIYEENQYVIYMNDTRLTPIKGSLKDFIILIEDYGDGSTKIKDFMVD